jgi:hypothetical protein
LLGLSQIVTSLIIDYQNEKEKEERNKIGFDLPSLIDIDRAKMACSTVTAVLSSIMILRMLLLNPLLILLREADLPISKR